MAGLQFTVDTCLQHSLALSAAWADKAGPTPQYLATTRRSQKLPRLSVDSLNSLARPTLTTTKGCHLLLMDTLKGTPHHSTPTHTKLPQPIEQSPENSPHTLRTSPSLLRLYPHTHTVPIPSSSHPSSLPQTHTQWFPTCSISARVSGLLASFLMLKMILVLAPFVTLCVNKTDMHVLSTIPL